jgi:hypothetical protein
MEGYKDYLGLVVIGMFGMAWLYSQFRAGRVSARPREQAVSQAMSHWSATLDEVTQDFLRNNLSALEAMKAGPSTEEAGRVLEVLAAFQARVIANVAPKWIKTGTADVADFVAEVTDLIRRRSDRGRFDEYLGCFPKSNDSFKFAVLPSQQVATCFCRDPEDLEFVLPLAIGLNWHALVLENRLAWFAGVPEADVRRFLESALEAQSDYELRLLATLNKFSKDSQ